MKEEARRVLERAITQLDDTVRDDPTEWAKEADKLDPSDPESIDEFVSHHAIYTHVILAGFQGMMSAVGSIIYGANAFTPALTHKGWMFWRRLPVTEDEKRALEEALLRSSSCMSSVAAHIPNDVGESGQMSPIERLEGLRKSWGILAQLYSCVRRYSSDLRQVLESSSNGVGTEKGRVGMSRTTIQKTIQRKSSSTEARKVSNDYLAQGIRFMNNGAPDRAISDFREAIRFNPQNSHAYANRGQAYLTIGQYERAVEDLNDAITLDPLNADAYRSRGLAYQAMGFDAGAQKEFSMAEKLQRR